MRRTATERNTGGPGRCSWCTHPDGARWTQQVLDGQSIRSVAARTPYGESAGRRHIRNHVQADLRVVSENNAAEGLRLTNFATRLLALADEAAAVRQHAHQTHNAALLLKAAAHERDTLLALVSRLGIDAEESLDLFKISDATMAALHHLVGDHPELADGMADAIEAVGSQEAIELAQGVRQIASRRTPQLHAVPRNPTEENPR